MHTCSSCGANWTDGEHTEGCERCGGGALERPCVMCGGACGAVWRKAIMDTNDLGVAHWHGFCSKMWDA